MKNTNKTDHYISDQEVTEKLLGNEKKKKPKLGMIDIALIVIAAVIVGFLVWFFVFRTVTPDVPELTIGQGSFDTAQTVRIRNLDGNMKYYYTLDGNEPTENSLYYDSQTGIEISKTSVLKIIAVDSKGNKSPVVNATYQIAGSDNYSGAPFDLTSTVVDWNFNDKAMQNSFTAITSSYIINQETGFNYPAKNLIDNDTKTGWGEDVEGLGVGEEITLRYTGTSSYTVTKIYIIAGYAQSLEVFNMNSVPTKMDVLFNNQKIGQITLYNSEKAQMIQLERPLIFEKGDTLTFKITEAQQGINDTHQDTFITEIRLDT